MDLIFVLFLLCFSTSELCPFLTRPVANIAVNKIDIKGVKYHFSRARVTIIWSLWRHQQSIATSSAERNRPTETRGRCVKIVVVIVIYGFVMSYKKYNNVCTLVTVYALPRVLFWCLFPRLLRWNNPPMSAKPFATHACFRLFIIYINVF